MFQFYCRKSMKTRRCEFKCRSRQRIFPSLQCQINMNLVSHISEGGSEVDEFHVGIIEL